MNQIVIQVDVDNILYDSDPVFSRIAKDNGIKWIERAITWFTPEEIGATPEEIKKVFRTVHSKEVVAKNTPYPDAAEALQYLADNFHVEIYYVSDRNAQQSSALSMWLEDNGFFNEAVRGVVVTKDKRDWMKINQPHVVIDDRVRTLIYGRFELDSICYGIAHNHNLNLKNEIEGIEIVDNWKILGKNLSNKLQWSRSYGKRTTASTS